MGVVVQIHHQVSRLLGHPGPVRVGAHPDPNDPARLYMQEHQHVQGLEEHRLDGEEVAGEDAVGLRREELMPGGAIPGGAGPRPARRRMARIVVVETMIPKPWSSPLIRTHPQRGFSLAMRTISAWSRSPWADVPVEGDACRSTCAERALGAIARAWPGSRRTPPSAPEAASCSSPRGTACPCDAAWGV